MAYLRNLTSTQRVGLAIDLCGMIQFGGVVTPSFNPLSPGDVSELGRRQAITWTNDNFLSIGHQKQT